MARGDAGVIDDVGELVMVGRAVAGTAADEMEGMGDVMVAGPAEGTGVQANKPESTNSPTISAIRF